MALWLKIGAGAGAVPPVLMIAALIYRGQQVVGPKLRRPLFGGIVKSPLAVTDNHGRAAWMSMAAARERFSGVHPDLWRDCRWRGVSGRSGQSGGAAL